ncbi:ABC transporter permease [Kiloniella laminariae]|uniref:ABC transporter permease n=1 Tax=Kiloniella laminariae TaxID=454162 RepID=A0ABT4LIV7_9PROT|nr:ABC transporter permease [Kiloniella laminariae]MCZ4280291.1 ABC transporter permease [Kiloniella laminariae]
MLDIFDILISAGFWAATLRIVSPLILGTLGELICERAGVLNLGIEGIMTMGAMCGWMWVYMGGDLWSGVLFAAFVGALFGLLHSSFTVYLGLSQHVTGIGITLFASSLSYYVFRMLLPNATTPPKIVPFQPYEIPLLSDIPVVGEALFSQTPLTYLALLLVPAVWYVLYKTPVGLAVRMAGENPMAVEAQGINVLSIRTGAVMVGSAFMAVGGAFITMSAFDAFYFGMINGRGWICVALVIFASWRPGKALIGALLFAGLDALQVRAQQMAGAIIPYQFFLMLPYILSIVAMVIMARRASYPQALLTPFRRGERT